MYERLWKREVTVSTIMILPSVSTSFKTIYADKSLPYAFLHLMWSHGFLNAYSGIMKNMDIVKPVELKKIWLLFNRKKSMKEISQKLGGYYSLNEWILDSGVFDEIYFANSKYIVYQLSLPEEWKDDYILISNSKYSKTSDEYQEHIRIKHMKVARTSGISAFVVSRNLPFLMSKKDKGIKSELEEYLGVKLSDDQEFLPKFRKDKESLDMNLLTS